MLIHNIYILYSHKNGSPRLLAKLRTGQLLNKLFMTWKMVHNTRWLEEPRTTSVEPMYTKSCTERPVKSKHINQIFEIEIFESI